MTRAFARKTKRPLTDPANSVSLHSLDVNDDSFMLKFSHTPSREQVIYVQMRAAARTVVDEVLIVNHSEDGILIKAYCGISYLNAAQAERQLTRLAESVSVSVNRAFQGKTRDGNATQS